MESTEINFINANPGAVRYGNFINYYSFHSTEQRTVNLQEEMFPKPVQKEPYLCLDVGCNTGELTIKLYKYIKVLYPDIDIYILAIDIDNTLIERAKAFKHENIKFITSNIMTEKDRKYIHTFLNDFHRERFNVIFCFSVTMWLHINNGDEGLEDFLNMILKISKCVIVEPQPWNCYRTAQRRLKKSGSTFPLYEKLKVRSNVDLFIENKIIESGYKKVHESQSSSWKRKIQSYQTET